MKIIKDILANPAHYRKFFVAVALGAAQIVDLGLVHGQVARDISEGLAVLMAMGVLHIPNKPKV